jgi:hypothetical protein
MAIDPLDPMPPHPLIHVAIPHHFAFMPTATPLSQEMPMDTMPDSSSPLSDHLLFSSSH